MTREADSFNTAERIWSTGERYVTCPPAVAKIENCSRKSLRLRQKNTAMIQTSLQSAEGALDPLFGESHRFALCPRTASVGARGSVAVGATRQSEILQPQSGITDEWRTVTLPTCNENCFKKISLCSFSADRLRLPPDIPKIKFALQRCAYSVRRSSTGEPNPSDKASAPPWRAEGNYVQTQSYHCCRRVCSPDSHKLQN